MKIFIILFSILVAGCVGSFPIKPNLNEPVKTSVAVSPVPPITVLVRIGAERVYILEDVSFPGPNTRQFIDIRDMNRQGGVLLGISIKAGGGVIEERSILEEIFTTSARWIRYSVAAVGRNRNMYIIHFTVETSTGYRRNYSVSGIFGNTVEDALGNAVTKSVEVILSDPNIKAFLKGV